MKISPLNYLMNAKLNKIQNFQGLWGKTSRTSDFDQALGIPKVEEVCYYYPFSDEAPSEIQSVVEKNTKAYIDESDEVPKYWLKECKVCTTLPFNELSYLNYATMSKPKIQGKLRVVHALAKDKYTDNVYGPNQCSAVNEQVGQNFNIKG